MSKPLKERWWLLIISMPVGLIVALVMDWIEYFNSDEAKQ